jgi:pyruvate dehydrogenase (quinone)
MQGSPRVSGCRESLSTSPDDIGPAWDRALAADRPTLLDVYCDPNVPPIPPHATLDQMKDAGRAILKGGRAR